MVPSRCALREVRSLLRSLAFVVVILGGFTANVPGAAPACQGFPLCNGSVITEGAAQTIHWTHRLLAFLFTLHVIGMTIAARKRGSVAMQRATTALLGIIVAQIVLAAILVSTHLPKGLQSAHQAVGTLVWLARDRRGSSWALRALRALRALNCSPPQRPQRPQRSQRPQRNDPPRPTPHAGLVANH